MLTAEIGVFDASLIGIARTFFDWIGLGASVAFQTIVSPGVPGPMTRTDVTAPGLNDSWIRIAAALIGRSKPSRTHSCPLSGSRAAQAFGLSLCSFTSGGPSIWSGDQLGADEASTDRDPA